MSDHIAPPQAGQPGKKKGGSKFKLLLVLLVLAGGGYAAMKYTGWRPGLPKSAGASAAATAAAAAAPTPDKAFEATLQQVRGNLAAYRRDHRNKNPDFQRDANPWQQMVSKTDESGVPGPAGKFGPYFSQRPVNPVNGFSNVELVDGPPAKGKKFKSVGWVIDRKTGQAWGTTATGEVDPR